uniref:Mediator of RNA polymerase II transcription subunit 11 n=1 Tax=Theileria annulata TaxID=5874 RepID=A0A3B0MQK6_THEAN
MALDESKFLSEITGKISNILLLESEILKNVKLDTNFGPGSRTINTEKLDRLTDLSRELFSYITFVSDELHSLTREINPSYTRVSPFHLNKPLNHKGLNSFSYTLPLELQASKQFNRLLQQFLSQ